MTTSNLLGRLKVGDKPKVAPTSEIFLAVHFILGVLSEKTINVNLGTISRGVECRLSMMMRPKPSDPSTHNSIAARRFRTGGNFAGVTGKHMTPAWFVTSIWC